MHPRPNTIFRVRLSGFSGHEMRESLVCQADADSVPHQGKDSSRLLRLSITRTPPSLDIDTHGYEQNLHQV